MVISVEKICNPEKIRTYTGNDLKLTIFDNKRTLIITGNNCKVKLNENRGFVKVIGDSCELTVLGGNGNIEYIGNNGKIRLGHDVPEDGVIYVGNKGDIASDNNDCSSAGYQKLNKKKHDNETKHSNKNLVNICNSSKVRCTGPNLLSDVNIPIYNISKHIRKKIAIQRKVQL